MSRSGRALDLVRTVLNVALAIATLLTLLQLINGIVRSNWGNVAYCTICLVIIAGFWIATRRLDRRSKLSHPHPDSN